MASPAPALKLPFDVAPYDGAPIVTDRLVLRPLGDSDVADVWEYQRLDEVLRFIPWPRRTAEEGAEHTRKRAGMRTISADGDAVFFACVLPGEPSLFGDGDGRVVGDVMLRLSDAGNADVEIGWVFHPDYAGRGFATEASAAVLALAFRALDAHRVHAQLDPRNTASAALCERLGMRHEGTTRETFYDKGEWSDSAFYGILRSEFDAR
ncbi:MAG: GNAT family protein [Leifsonia flava]